MNKNILIIVGSIFVIGLVVFFASNSKDEKVGGINQEQRDAVRSEVQERVGVSQIADGEYSVDKDSSQVKWIGRAVGKKHNGRVDIKSAKINFSEGLPKSGVLVFDMTSISDDDLGLGMQEKLSAHLKSNDFFAVADYPEARLEIKNSQKIEGENMYRVTADLTIKDKTNEVIFDAAVEEKNDTVVLSTTFDIDRTKWGVNFGSENVAEKIGNQIIDDMISFNVIFVGSKDDKIMSIDKDSN